MPDLELQVPGKTVQITIRRDTVEIRVEDRLVGVGDREKLRAWLEGPKGVFAFDDINWYKAGGGIAIGITDLVRPWTLADHDVQQLREGI